MFCKRSRFAYLTAAFWWSSLCFLGFLVVPILFAYLPSKALAGQTAARLFTAQTWVSLVCGLLLLALSREKPSELLNSDSDLNPEKELKTLPISSTFVDWAKSALFLPCVLSAMLLALLTEFVIAPHIIGRDNLKLWHSIGSIFYFSQCIILTILVWRWTDSKNK